MSLVTIDGKDKAMMMVWRLGMILPLTPWSIVFYYQTLGDYSVGRHSANALRTIASQVIVIDLCLSIVGIIMALMSGVSGGGKTYAIAWIIVHYIVFFFYIVNNTVTHA